MAVLCDPTYQKIVMINPAITDMYWEPPVTSTVLSALWEVSCVIFECTECSPLTLSLCFHRQGTTFVTGWQQPPVSHVSHVSWLHHFLPPFHVIPCPVHTQMAVPMSGKKLCQVAGIERRLKVTKNGKGKKSVPAIVVHHSGLSHSTTAAPLKDKNKGTEQVT